MAMALEHEELREPHLTVLEGGVDQEATPERGPAATEAEKEAALKVLVEQFPHLMSVLEDEKPEGHAEEAFDIQRKAIKANWEVFITTFTAAYFSHFDQESERLASEPDPATGAFLYALQKIGVIPPRPAKAV